MFFWYICVLTVVGPIQAKSSWHLEYLGEEKEAVFSSLGFRIEYKKKESENNMISLLHALKIF